MALRLTNTLKWQNEWFLSLSCEHQNTFQYLWDMCDAAGVWPISPTAVSMCTHAAFSLKGFVAACNGLDLAADGTRDEHVRILAGGRHLWLVYFVITTNPNSLDASRQPRHKPIIEGLKRWQLLDEVNRQYAALQKGSVVEQTEIEPVNGELRASLEAEFERLWRVYPRKVGKQQAFKAFLKHVAPKVEAMMKVILPAVEAQSKTRQWREKDGQFVPHCATWLNSHRWEDEARGGTERKTDDRHRKGF